MGSFLTLGLMACEGNPQPPPPPNTDGGPMTDAGMDAPDMGRMDIGPIGTPNRNILVRTVIDGDTIIVSASSAVLTPDRRPLNGETIRFLGVDTPEIEHPPEPEECFGDEAKAFTEGKIDGRLVELRYDTANGVRDTFGRLLAYVVLSGEIINESLIRTGHARAFRQFPHRDRSHYIDLESQARSQNLGLWACP